MGPNKDEYGGRIIKLVSADVEGCFTPAKRTKTNLAGLEEVQDYTSKVEIYGLPPINLVTGRNAPYVEKLVQDIGALGDRFTVYSVIENGALFYDHNTRQIAGKHPALKGKESTMEEVRRFIDSLKKKYRANIREEPGKEVCISLNPIEWGIKDLYEVVVEEFGEKGFNEVVDITHSASAVDITPKGVEKWTGLEYVLKEADIDPQYVLGIGDTKGDIPWLENIGVPTAPLNATEELKDAINGLWVSDYRDSKGVGHILQHFIVRHRE